jgi:cell filamentation protein
VSEPPRRYSWEDYLYPPNAAGVQILRNKPGLTEFGEWFQAERGLTFLRQQQLIAEPALVPRTFDTAHWKAIHHHLFQDMYEWAGEFRMVNIGKDGHGFAPADQLELYSEEILGQVRAANMFAGWDRAGVVEHLSYTMQAINIIHPFREGNGRTQRILSEHIAEHAGYVLDWHRIDPEEQNRMMAAAFEGELGPLQQALGRAVLPLFRGGAVDESPWPTEPTGPARAPSFWQLTKSGQQVLSESRSASAAPSDAPSSTPALPAEQQHERSR